MISRFDNCLFIHIPKVAGQSVETIFLERAGLSWNQREAMLLKPNANPKQGPPRLAHLTANEYLTLGYLSLEDYNSLYKFTFVRNPWDRLVSEYKYRKYRFSFDDFLFKHFPQEESDNYENSFDTYRHVLPQYKFVYDSKCKIMVDFVGKYESLIDDFSFITSEITGKSIQLPHINASHNISHKERLGRLLFKSNNEDFTGHYTKFYNRKRRDFVASLYKMDIELFEYQFN